MIALNALPAAVLRTIDGYSPGRSIWTWPQIGPFVRHAVTRACPYNERKAREFMMGGTHHVNYWVGAQGYELTDELWDLDLAANYVASLTNVAPRTRYLYGGHLRDLINRLHRDQSHPERGRLGNPSEPLIPYRADEVPGLFSWAAGRSTVRAKRLSHALVTLGLAYGVTVTDMLTITPAHLTDLGGDGILLTLPDRALPSDEDYDDDVRQMIADHRTERRFLPQETPEEVNSFLGSARRVVHAPPGRRPLPRRLRATWLARRSTHLDALTTVMRGYGISHTNTLQTALPWFPELPEAPAADVLRTTKGAHT